GLDQIGGQDLLAELAGQIGRRRLAQVAHRGQQDMLLSGRTAAAAGQQDEPAGNESGHQAGPETGAHRSLLAPKAAAQKTLSLLSAFPALSLNSIQITRILLATNGLDGKSRWVSRPQNASGVHFFAVVKLQVRDHSFLFTVALAFTV